MDYNKLLKNKVNQDIKNILKNPLNNIPDINQAIEISKKYNLSLHPKYLLYWNELDSKELINLLTNLKESIEYKNKEIMINSDQKKRALELIGLEHEIKNNQIIISKYNSEILLINLGIEIKEISKINIKKQIEIILKYAKKNTQKNSIEILNENNIVQLRDKGGSYIGARMGRPEKAKMRKKFNEETSSKGLFSVGESFGRSKNIIEALKEEKIIEEDFQIFYCEKCGDESIYPYCVKCKSKARQMFFERFTNKEISQQDIKEVIAYVIKYLDKISKEQDIKKQLQEIEKEEIIDEKKYERIKDVFTILKDKLQDNLLKNKLENIVNSVYFKKIKLDIKKYKDELFEILKSTEVEKLKSVKGITKSINKHHTIEHLVKPILRAKHGLFVNKDATIRYDMIEMGLTHFKPVEIGTSIEKLKELGYTKDYLGNILNNQNQIVEIFPQDVILPDCRESGDELASDFVINVGNYVDELLEKFYKQKSFYNFKNKEDTIGHLIVGLAPHTSCGVIGRIIGYSKTQGCFAHPIWHAAQRRNLDGDETAIMLLMDCLVNFSRDYLPDRRGSKTMDVALVLTSIVNLDQVDDEVYGLDIVDHYSKEFYDACRQYKYPKDVKINQVISKLKEENETNKYSNYLFTHDVENFNETVLYSAYKSIPTMQEKLDVQLNLADKIRAVNENKVASLIIDKHFLRDIKGNLRKFSQQNFRCTSCNAKYRRPPISGKCLKCGEFAINFTVHQGSIKKYIEPSVNIIKKYRVDPYVKEVIDLVNMRVEGLFGELKK